MQFLATHMRFWNNNSEHLNRDTLELENEFLKLMNIHFLNAIFWGDAEVNEH